MTREARQATDFDRLVAMAFEVRRDVEPRRPGRHHNRRQVERQRMRCVVASPGLTHDDDGDAEQAHESGHLDRDVDDDDVRAPLGHPRRDLRRTLGVATAERGPVQTPTRIGVDERCIRFIGIRRERDLIPVGQCAAAEIGDDVPAPRQFGADDARPRHVPPPVMVHVVTDAHHDIAPVASG